MTQPAVLIVEDDENLRTALLDTLADERYPVLAADNGVAALNIINHNDVGLVVSDWQMQPMNGIALLGEIRKQHPAIPAVLMTAHGSIRNAIDVMKAGASEYLVKPFAAETLKRVVNKHLRTQQGGSGPVAADALSIEMLRISRRVAATDVTVTLNGPSGCGKEVFARYIHDQSPRKDQPFVAINCAAIPETMLEAVLFGYEKGAFTGATAAHAGKFEQASGGTLLLDEISEMDLGLQAKLLRVIQEKEVERIGGKNVISLDVRVLATTNRDLRQFVAEGKFREDLYYRLNVFPLHIPALADRRGDILPLAELMVSRYATNAVTLSACAADKLLQHDWPGNVRELENAVQRALILLGGSQLRAEDLQFDHNSGAPEENGGLSVGLKNREFQLIIDALKEHGGKRTAVANALGISPRSLRYKLARMRAEGVAIPGELS